MILAAGTFDGSFIEETKGDKAFLREIDSCQSSGYSGSGRANRAVSTRADTWAASRHATPRLKGWLVYIRAARPKNELARKPAAGTTSCRALADEVAEVAAVVIDALIILLTAAKVDEGDVLLLSTKRWAPRVAVELRLEVVVEEEEVELVVVVLEEEEDDDDDVELELELELEEVELELGELVLVELGATEDEEEELGAWAAAFAWGPLTLLLLLPPSGPNTMMLAVDPLGTVTTQKLPPPAPTVALVLHSFTLWMAGSMAHGRPLQPPSGHSILTPQLGITSRNGVAGSR